MKLFPDRKKTYRPAVRLIAGILLPCVLVVLMPTELIPQTYNSYDDAKLKVDRYFDRAGRMQARQDWENYVDLGIAHERVEWEQDAYEILLQKVRSVESDVSLDKQTKEARVAEEVALYEAAGQAWDEAATQDRDEELGRFLAVKEAVSVAERDADEYETIIANVQAAVAVNPAATLADWDAALSADHTALISAFETELNTNLDTARANNTGLTGDSLTAFEAQLNAIENELRAEFETRDRFYITRARNRYVAVLRGDDLSARLAAEEGSAEAVVEQLITATEEKLKTETTDQLQAALEEATALTSPDGAADFEAAGANWEARMEAVIDSGLRAWQTAEEDLYAKRLAWQQNAQTEREQGEAIWKAQYDELVGARNRWLDEVQVQIQSGRDEWQAKIAEFQGGRQQAEQELADYIQSERERWDAASAELADIVNGGGAALLETKDAYRYYEELIAAIGPPGAQDPRDAEIYNFYVQQRDYMQGAVGRFQTILAGAEGVLQSQMHSGDSSSGLLNDVRLLAGDLPETVAAIGAGNYETDLLTEMQNRGEDFLLYRRDLEGLLERNAIFTTRAGELQGSSDFNYQGAADLSAMASLVGALDRKYDEHRVELAGILSEDRSGMADDAARLADIKSDIDAWFALSTNKNERLKQETVDYFNVGLGGYYLTGNEGDPYLMTRAEYEWELLRRERNYLSKKLRRAEEVKRYADLAFQFEAGLEMAAVTAEHTEIAKVQRDLMELSYLLVKGDAALALDPAVYSDTAVRDSELARLLNERGIDTAALDAREATLAQEGALLDAVIAYGSAPTAAEINTLIANIDAYLETAIPDSTANFTEARGEHPLGITRAKLIEFRDRIEAGADATETADRWTVLAGGAGALRGELQAVADAYDFNGLRVAIETLRDRMDDENLTTIRGDLDQIKQQIEANTTLLSQAKAELDLAKDAYRQARIDFDVIRAGNSEDLIRIDLLNTTAMLSSVTHRMASIEDIDGWNGVYSAADEQRIRYLNEISERERAVTDLNASQAAYEMVQALEEAKRRGRELQTLITSNGGANGLAGLEAKALADVLIGSKANVLTTGASSEGLNSTAAAREAFSIIEFARGELDGLETALNDAITGGDAQEIALARANLATMQDAVYRHTEAFVAAVRGEETARTEGLLYYLDGGDAEALTQTVVDGEEALQEEAFELSEAAAVRLADFLDTNQGQSFAQLLEAVNTAIAGLTRGMELSDGYGQANGLDDRTRSEWNIVRAWLMNNQATIEYANEAPAEFTPTSVADKWDALLEGAQGLADEADAYSEFAAAIPTSATDAWVVNYVSEHTALKNNIQTVLANSDTGLAAAYAALNAAEREMIHGYVGSVDPARTSDLRLALEQAGRIAGLDAAAAPSNYKAYYSREKSREYGARLGEIEIALADEGARMQALEAEKKRTPAV